jgi:tetratricopeptide (TPR) repeat protein
MQNYDDALKHYQIAVDIDPNCIPAVFGLGNSYYLQNKFDPALEHLTRALELKPDFLKARSVLANALYKKGNIKDALEHAYIILDAKHDMLYYLNFIAWERATNPDKNLQNPHEAIELALKACELAKYDSPEVLDTLAASYAADGNFEKAVTTAQKAINLAQEKSKPQLEKRIQKRLELYKQQKPYRRLN